VDKVILFGGSFDPIHLGHTACLKHLTEEMDFSKVFLVPTSINPLKMETRPAKDEDRIKMIQLAVEESFPGVALDDREISQDGAAYTWDTLSRYFENYNPGDVYLAMGQDAFMGIDQWKDYEKILESVNIVVLSRPPLRRPFSIEEFPEGVRTFVSSYEKGFCLLKTHKTIEFVKINTEDISSSEIRNRFRRGKGVAAFLPLEVEKYIVNNHVYPIKSAEEYNFDELAQYAGNFLNAKAMNVLGYNLTGMEKPFDFALVASASSKKQAQSLAINLRESIKEKYGLSPYVEDGVKEGRWAVLDYAAIVIHIFYDFVRQEYHLEDLWKEGQKLKFEGGHAKDRPNDQLEDHPENQ